MSIKGNTYGRQYVNRAPVKVLTPDPWAADHDDHSRHLEAVLKALKAIGHSRFPVLNIEYNR